MLCLVDEFTAYIGDDLGLSHEILSFHIIMILKTTENQRITSPAVPNTDGRL